MEIKVNKEVLDYTESIFFGLSLRQCICSLMACIIAMCIYFGTIDIFGKELTSWFCIIGVIPFALLGFVKYQGLFAEQMLLVIWQSFLLMQRDLVSKPINLYYTICFSLIEQQKRKDLNTNDKKLRKI